MTGNLGTHTGGSVTESSHEWPAKAQSISNQQSAISNHGSRG
jgi:hypothetical protein